MILIALGSNLPSKYGDSEMTLRMAMQRMEERGVVITKTSNIYSTAPVPVSDQPWFKNAVIAVETSIDPYAVLRILQSIEREFGPKPIERNGERILDLDLLAYGNRVIMDAYMGLPHPRMHQRGFVLYPLHDIAPDWIHPVLDLSVHEMIDVLPADQVLDEQSVVAA